MRPELTLLPEPSAHNVHITASPESHVLVLTMMIAALMGAIAHCSGKHVCHWQRMCASVLSLIAPLACALILVVQFAAYTAGTAFEFALRSSLWRFVRTLLKLLGSNLCKSRAMLP